MPGLGVGVGIGQYGGIAGGLVAAGPSYVFSDEFASSISSAWTNTGAVTVLDGAASLVGTGTWGGERLLHTAGLARVAGRTLVSLVLYEDLADDLAVGWASGVVADARSDGHSYLNNDGWYEFAVPGKKVTLSGTASPQYSAHRHVPLLVIVVLRAQGALYFLSAPRAVSPMYGAGSASQVTIPEFPTAALMYIEDSSTTTPMYPVLSAAADHGYRGGHRVFYTRVLDVADWNSDSSGLADLDRMNRADSAVSLGTGWTARFGTWGISSNKGYLVSTPGGNFPRASRNSGLSGDGIWRCKVTAPTTTTNGFGIMIREVDSNNFIRVWNNGGNSIAIQTWVAGAFGAQIASFPVTWVAGQEYQWEVRTQGNLYQFYLDDVMLIDWTADANNRHLTGTGYGPYTSSIATGTRWDDFMTALPTATLPTDVQYSAELPQFTAGAIIMQDTFTAADGTAIAGRTPDTVGTGAWEVSGAGFQITGNALVNTNVNGVDQADWAVYDCGVSDVEITCSVTTPAAGDRLRDGYALRYTNSGSVIYPRWFMDDPGQPGVDEIETWESYPGSSAVDFSKAQFGSFFALNTTYTYKVQIKDKWVLQFIDGNLIHAHRVIASYVGTKFGIYHNRVDDGMKFNDITIRALS